MRRGRARFIGVVIPNFEVLARPRPASSFACRIKYDFCFAKIEIEREVIGAVVARSKSG